VATSLRSESFMRALEYTATPSARSRLLILFGWASARPVGAENAAVAEFRPERGAFGSTR
jgi:hypothetical protein